MITNLKLLLEILLYFIYDWSERCGRAYFVLDSKYKGIAKSDDDVLSIALFGDVALKYIKKRNDDAIPTKLKLEA